MKIIHMETDGEHVFRIVQHDTRKGLYAAVATHMTDKSGMAFVPRQSVWAARLAMRKMLEVLKTDTKKKDKLEVVPTVKKAKGK